MDKDNAIVRSLSGIQVTQRDDDGYVNATQLLKAHKAATGENQKISKWMDTERAKAYVELISKRCKISPLDLVQSKPGKGGGTWIHPDLAVPFATWLSIEFEFQVSRWVQEWMTTGRNPVDAAQTRADIIRSLMPLTPLDWKCRYKTIFWERLATLYGFQQGNPACAIWINKFVYGYFPEDVRARLDEINPLIDGKRKNLQHCHFDGELLDQLEKHLSTVFDFMEIADSRYDFEKAMNTKFKGLRQLQLIDFRSVRNDF